jgi:hypothetical protein
LASLAIPDPGDPRLWWGSLTTGRFTLEIVAEPERTRTLRVPTKLALEKGLKVTFSSEGPEEIVVPRRNGFSFLGTSVSVDGPEGMGSRGELRGIPTPGDPRTILWIPAEHRGPFEATVSVEIYHWADGSVHEVLWKKTFRVSFTAEEIDAMR